MAVLLRAVEVLPRLQRGSRGAQQVQRWLDAAERFLNQAVDREPSADFEPEHEDDNIEAEAVGAEDAKWRGEYPAEAPRWESAIDYAWRKEDEDFKRRGMQRGRRGEMVRIDGRPVQPKAIPPRYADGAQELVPRPHIKAEDFANQQVVLGGRRLPVPDAIEAARGWGNLRAKLNRRPRGGDQRVVPTSLFYALPDKLANTIEDVREGRLSFSTGQPLLVSALDAPKGAVWLVDGYHRFVEGVLAGVTEFPTIIAEFLPRIEYTGGAYEDMLRRRVNAKEAVEIAELKSPKVLEYISQLPCDLELYLALIEEHHRGNLGGFGTLAPRREFVVAAFEFCRKNHLPGEIVSKVGAFMRRVDRVGARLADDLDAADFRRTKRERAKARRGKPNQRGQAALIQRLRIGQTLYHGTSAKSRFDYPNGPAWFSEERGVAKRFTGWGGGPRSAHRVLIYEVVASPKLARLLDIPAFYRLGIELRGENIDAGHELAEATCARYDGWIAPNNYSPGADIMLCEPERWLKFIRTERP